MDITPSAITSNKSLIGSNSIPPILADEIFGHIKFNNVTITRAMIILFVIVPL